MLPEPIVSEYHIILSYVRNKESLLVKVVVNSDPPGAIPSDLSASIDSFVEVQTSDRFLEG